MKEGRLRLVVLHLLRIGDWSLSPLSLYNFNQWISTAKYLLRKFIRTHFLPSIILFFCICSVCDIGNRYRILSGQKRTWELLRYKINVENYWIYLANIFGSRSKNWKPEYNIFRTKINSETRAVFYGSRLRARDFGTHFGVFKKWI